MNLIKHRYIFLSIAVVLVLVSWGLVGFLGLKQGIDLKGGAEWRLFFEDVKPDEKAIQESISKNFPHLTFSIKSSGDGLFIIRLPDTNEEEHLSYLKILEEQFGKAREDSFSNIGPTIGKELKNQAIKAILAVLLGISLYIAFAFRKVSKPVPSWKYGTATLLCLLHDVSIPTGLLAFLGWWKGIEIDTNFIVALLVVMGFSVHDTIVVFDRIRENITVKKANISFGEVINSSVKETLVRSINTSLTLIFVLLALLIWGPLSLFYFILVILIGTVVGTYSSIFVASPIIYIWAGKKKI